MSIIAHELRNGGRSSVARHRASALCGGDGPNPSRIVTDQADSTARRDHIIWINREVKLWYYMMNLYLGLADHRIRANLEAMS